MKFLDLFAGLGGFHVGLRRLGHECVLACEIDQDLSELYERNFGIRPYADIRKLRNGDIPNHDILCAGSPCQPFSKAGDQQGADCPRWGDLLEHVLRIARAQRPKFLLLENVPNLLRHDEGQTWAALERSLSRIGYDISSASLSPHQFGVPQIRERVFIVGSLNGLSQFSWPKPKLDEGLSIRSVLDCRPESAKPLSKRVIECLTVWQQFLRRFPKQEDLPWFPIWAAEFGATYPFDDLTPATTRTSSLRRYRGSFGQSLRRNSRAAILSKLPSYARVVDARFPTWKRTFIRLNRELYRQNRTWIDKWLPALRDLPPSWQKFEWNCKGEERDIWKYVIQFRASGVRVKRPTTAPSLVAMTATQVPIIAWERRYMTPRECSRLQSLQELPFLPSKESQSYKALGNAVNASLVEEIGRALLSKTTESKSTKRKSASQEQYYA